MISLKKSFSPSINRELSVKSLKTVTPNDLLLCNDILKINSYVSSKVKKMCIKNVK